MSMNKNKLITEYSKAIKDKTAAVFIGAGFSVPSGFVNWTQLLNNVATELGLDIEEEKHDLISLIQYYMNNKRNRGAINQLLEDKYGNREAPLTENHKILSRLPIKYYWTTNYDNLIERSINDAGRTPDIKKCKNDLSIVKRKRDAIIYKMHGDIESPDKAIITKDDYETYSIKHELFSTALRGDLVSKTFLFLGFSFEDPNLNYILSRIRILLNEDVKEHYCIFKKVNPIEYETNAEFIRAETKQNLRIEDLKRYGIQTLLIDDYTDITNILQGIEYQFKLSNIFISGSADEYQPWGQDKSLKFVRDLSKEIASNDIKIISGFGKGIGAEVVNGALDYVYSTNYHHIDDYLILRPFPYMISNQNERKSILTKYREDMISNVGISIFIFGNKTKDGRIVFADGMREEFEISKRNGKILIPVGATEYISEEFWNEVLKDFDKLYEENPALIMEFNELNNKNLEPEQLIEIIINIINKLNK